MKRIMLILGCIGLITTGFAEERATLPKDIKLVSSNEVHLPVINNNISLDDDISIEFDLGNFFSVTTGFSEKLLADFSEHLINYEGEEMLIYFDSPGGSVFSMARMIGLMQSSPVKFKCVARFAASAAFNMFEACDKRYILPDGVIMSHEWSGGFRDEAPRILSLYNAISHLVSEVENLTVSRMNIDMRTYKELINKNLWMTKTLATKYGAIDGVVNKVTCSKKLAQQRVKTVVQQRGLFGPINITIIKNGCPLISKTYKEKPGREYYSSEETSEYTAIAQLKDNIGTHSVTFQLRSLLDKVK